MTRSEARRQYWQKYRELHPPAPVLVPQNRRSAAARVAWQKRREKFGSAGCSAEVVEKMREATTARLARSGHPNAKKTHCPQGHKYTAANTYLIPSTGGRLCRACIVLRDNQRKWRKLHAVHIARLKAQMIAAHPDKGGTSRKFIEARRLYLRALAS